MFRHDNQKGAENICKELGYTGGTHYTVPGGSGPILAGNRLCSGGEKTIWDCLLQAGKTDTHRCSHDIDQGVSCTGGTYRENGIPKTILFYIFKKVFNPAAGLWYPRPPPLPRPTTRPVKIMLLDILEREIALKAINQ